MHNSGELCCHATALVAVVCIGFCWLEIPKTGFPMMQLISYISYCFSVEEDDSEDDEEEDEGGEEGSEEDGEGSEVEGSEDEGSEDEGSEEGEEGKYTVVRFILKTSCHV